VRFFAREFERLAFRRAFRCGAFTAEAQQFAVAAAGPSRSAHDDSHQQKAREHAGQKPTIAGESQHHAPVYRLTVGSPSHTR
jgi:hypothetical protein